jgi:hypothetical protein
MDKAVEVAFEMIEVIENYLIIPARDRYNRIKKIRETY